MNSGEIIEIVQLGMEALKELPGWLKSFKSRKVKSELEAKAEQNRQWVYDREKKAHDEVCDCMNHERHTWTCPCGTTSTAYTSMQPYCILCRQKENDAMKL